MSTTSVDIFGGTGFSTTLHEHAEFLNAAKDELTRIGIIAEAAVQKMKTTRDIYDTELEKSFVQYVARAILSRIGVPVESNIGPFEQFLRSCVPLLTNPDFPNSIYKSTTEVQDLEIFQPLSYCDSREVKLFKFKLAGTQTVTRSSILWYRSFNNHVEIQVEWTAYSMTRSNFKTHFKAFMTGKKSRHKQQEIAHDGDIEIYLEQEKAVMRAFKDDQTNMKGSQAHMPADANDPDVNDMAADDEHK